MTHTVTKYDVITDLKRCLYSSYSERDFDDDNVVVFLRKAEENLEKITAGLDEDTVRLINERIEKAKNIHNSLDKRREDLLMASCLLCP